MDMTVQVCLLSVLYLLLLLVIVQFGDNKVYVI